MSSTILHASYSQICGSPGGGVRCGEGGTPLPGSPSPGVTAMDAGRQPTGGPKQRRRVSSVVLDTSNSGILGPHRGAVRIREGGTASPDLSPVGTAIGAFNHPTDGPKRRRRVSSVVLDALDSGIAGFLLAVLRKGEVADTPPRCPSPVGTAMDGFTAPESGAKRRGRVSPAVVRHFWALIVSSLRAGSRNARGGHPSRHTHLRANQR